MWRIRTCLASTLAVVAVLIGAPAAGASSIVYTDANSNVWITSPDGATKRQITTNGATLGYGSPTETDAGVIVATSSKSSMFFYFKQDGTSPGGPWGAHDLHCGSMQPILSNQVKPDGAMNAYSFIELSSSCFSVYGATVGYANYNLLTASGIYTTFDQAWYPRWVLGTTYVAAADSTGQGIWYLDTPSGSTWLTRPVLAGGLTPLKVRYFDLTRDSAWALVAMSDDSAQPRKSTLYLWHQTAPLPAASGNVVCSIANWGDDNQAPDISMPRWAPDGSAFTWTDSQGIWVSPKPVDDGTGTCRLSPKLIVPGGYEPDWGLPDVAGAGVVGGSGGGGSTSGGGGSTQPGGAAGAITSATSSKPTSSGRITLTVAASGAGKLDALASVKKNALLLSGKGRSTYGKASATLSGAGTAKLTIKPSKAATRILARGRTLKVRVVLTLMPTGGAASSKQLSVTVRG